MLSGTSVLGRRRGKRQCWKNPSSIGTILPTAPLIHPSPFPSPKAPPGTSMNWHIFLLRQGRLLVATGLPHFLTSRFQLRIQQ